MWQCYKLTSEMGDGSTEKRSDSFGTTKGVYPKTNPDLAFQSCSKTVAPAKRPQVCVLRDGNGLTSITIMFPPYLSI